MRLLINRLAVMLAVIAIFWSNPVQAVPPVTPAAPVAKTTDVRLWVGRDVAPGPKIRLSLNSRNVPLVYLTAYKIDAIRWLLRRDVNRDPKLPPRPLAPGKPVREWTVSMADKNQRPTAATRDQYYSRQVNLPVLPPGVYLLMAHGGGKEAWGVVNITNLAIVLKRAPHQVLAWVTDNQSGAPLAGARVRLWDRRGARTVAEGVTKTDGVCSFSTAPDPSQTLIVERSDNGVPDVAGLAVGNSSGDGALVSHLQTDRPVYRPGGTVQFRAILRRTLGRVYSVVVGKPVDIEVRDSKENILSRTRKTTTAKGTVADSFTIPGAGVLGAYSIVLTLGEGAEKQAAYTTFTVAEYRKPEFKVTVTPQKNRYLSGQDGGFGLQADYYFGTPLPQAEIKYQIRRSPNPFYGILSGDSSDEQAQWFASGDGNLYARDTYSAEPFVAEGTVYTDKKGHADISFKTKIDLPDSAYSVSCTVVDGQRRQVAASASVPVFASTRRLGMHTSVLAAPLGTIVPVDLRLADLDNKPVSGRVMVVTQHQVYNEKTKEYQTKQLSQQSMMVGASGKATVRVPVLAEDSVEIVAMVRDGENRLTRATLSLWVINPQAKTRVEEKQPTVTIRLGKKLYEPGETAKIFLTTSTTSRPTLLTAEGESLFAYVVVPAGKTSFVWTVPTTLQMSPNAYISASQWARPSQMVGANVLLSVPDRTRRMTLTVTTDKPSYQPGDSATYTIRATDSKTGKPVPNAELSLAVVDESIFAVRPDAIPDPYETFWGQRGNKTDTRTSAPEELSGGAYQRSSPDGVAPVRERFLDTAFWAATLTTGPDGTTQATVELPGNLTAWRATVIGVTGDTRVGRTFSSLAVSRPVMLRLAVPRQFVQGDKLTLIGTVTNRTDKDRDFDVSLKPSGLNLAAGETDTKTVRVAAKNEGKVQWVVAADRLGDSPDSPARLEGTLIAKNLVPGELLRDYSDRLRLSIPVRPKGVASRIIVGGVLAAGDKEASLAPLALPADRIPDATMLTVTVEGGVGQAALSGAAGVLQNNPWNSSSAADLLQIAAAPNAPKADPTRLRDALALLSRDLKPDGAWGWWENAPTNARITAQVLQTLALAKRANIALPSGVPFPETLLQRGIAGAQNLYNQTSLWEERALLASALTAADGKKAGLLDEVRTRAGVTLSPYATLHLAETLASVGQKETAVSLLSEILPLAVTGPESAYIPAGDHPGWYASTTATTAQALMTLVGLGQNDALQSRLARWLAHPSDGENTLYLPAEDQSAVAQALLAYSRVHGISTTAPTEKDVTILVNGTTVPFAARAPGTENYTLLAAPVPRGLLKEGENTITLRRGDGTVGELFATATATVYRPQTGEIGEGMRVLRRWEMQNAYGLWEELMPGKTLHPSTPVRVTVVAWPNEEADALRVEEPLPSGFEFVDSELGNGAREEVRDGAIIHFLRADGATPITFRYFLRAEAEGEFSALPASGELIRRPSVRGGSAMQTITVRDANAKPR